jgi:bacteriocin-like protein
MAGKFNRIPTSAIPPATCELTETDMNKIVGGGSKETPKETVTFEYGALLIRYG